MLTNQHPPTVWATISWRLSRSCLLQPRARPEAARTWLHDETEVVDTTDRTCVEAVPRIADRVNG